MSISSATQSSLTDWLTALGTVGAIVVALFLAFLGNLLKKHRRPVLTTEFEIVEPFCRHTSVIVSDSVVPAYFLRVRVRNTGKSMARDCEGKLIRIFDAATKQERPNFDPSNLHWSGHGLDRSISIHSSAYEYLDIISVQGNTSDIIPVTIQMEPRGFPLALQRADYILDIVLFGKNTEPVEKFFKVHIEGDGWMMMNWDKVSLEETEL